MIRWLCPLCSRACLGLERPRQDDVRRYCLPCSKRTGRLVERAAPVLQARREKAAARRAVTTTRARDLEAERWTVAGEDVRQLRQRCWKVLVAVVKEDFADRFLLGGSHMMPRETSVPKIKLRRRAVDSPRGNSGWASGHAPGRITLLVAATCTRAQIRGLVLHELSHCARNWLKTVDPRDTPHGDTFNKIMVLAAERLWGVRVAVGPRGYWSTKRLDAALARLDAPALPQVKKGLM
jgi:hypothetical protein